MAKKEEEYITIVDDGKKKTSEIIAELRKLFPVRVYNESEIDKEFPPPKKSASRKFLLVEEADEDLKNKSAEDLVLSGIAGITLRERLLYESLYFKKSGRHLDINNITLCTGSRCSDGIVPGVDWSSGEVDVFWYDPGRSDAILRSRRAL